MTTHAADYWLIRPDIREALDGWGDGTTPFCGDFLRAVLSNDLTGAIGRADTYNRQTLPEITSYVHHNLPSNCHGSPAVVDAWAKYHRERLAAEREATTEPVADLKEALKASLIASAREQFGGAS